MSLFWFDHFLNLQVSIACNLGKFSVFFLFFFFFEYFFIPSFFLFSFQDSKLECDLCLELHRILRLYLISFQSISHLLFTLSSTVLP